jgi:RHS repeat-associated protein
MTYYEREEYRYDALGRRIWRRLVVPDSAMCRKMDSRSSCLSIIERTVWDGDQVSWELRADGGEGATVARMESDSFGPFVNGQLEGQVMYTHGAGLDHPLSIQRFGTFGSVIIPVYDWRGSAVGGYCALATTCSKLVWPEQLQSPWAEDPQPTDGTTGQPTYWAGNLIDTKKDGSGYVYMRNRYYDPATGRFTQTDPIGLAGGLNAYGFAGGDPINYDDPFGLCPVLCPDEVAPVVEAVAGATEVVAAATIVVAEGAAVIAAAPVIIGVAATVAVGGAIWWGVKSYSSSGVASDATKVYSKGKQGEGESSEHRTNVRESNRKKHEEGIRRKKMDQGREKGDKRRKPNPNKRKPSPDNPDQ